MKKIIPVLFALTTTTLWAQEVVPLWTGEAPYSKPNTLEEYVKESSYKVPCAYNVTKPTLTIHRALGTNSGRAMIVVPGGGFLDGGDHVGGMWRWSHPGGRRQGRRSHLAG